MPEDDKDALEALDALESEAKEWEKDAEIERILNAFRLDAYVPSPSLFNHLASLLLRPDPHLQAHITLTNTAATPS